MYALMALMTPFLIHLLVIFIQKSNHQLAAYMLIATYTLINLSPKLRPTRLLPPTRLLERLE